MRTLKIVVITVVAVVFFEVAAAEVYFRTHRFSAREKPSWLEQTLARHARDVSVSREVRSLKNPRALTDETMSEARGHWTEHCAICHGLDGRGDVTVGRSMSPPAPNMNDPATQQKTDGELYYIISQGVRMTGMPAWEGEDSPEAIWDLVSFIRHLPQITPEELRQMEEMGGEGEPEVIREGNGAEASSDGHTEQSKSNRVNKPGAKPSKHTHKHEH
jgi:mono/diheme cytochrome c family protein